MNNQRIAVQSGRFWGGSWEGRGLSVSTIEPRTPVREEGPPIARTGELICRIPNVPPPAATNKPPVTAITPSPAAPPSSPNKPSTPTAIASPGNTQVTSNISFNSKTTDMETAAEVNKAESIAAAAIAALAAAATCGAVQPLQGGHNRRVSQLIPDFSPQQLLTYRCQQRNQSQPLPLRSSVSDGFGAGGAARPLHAPGDEVSLIPTDSLPQVVDGSVSGSPASFSSGLSSTFGAGSCGTSSSSSKLKPSGFTHSCRMLSNVDASIMAVALPDSVEARSLIKTATLPPLRPPPLLPPLQRLLAAAPSAAAAAVLLTNNSGSSAAAGGAQLAAGSRSDGSCSTSSPPLTREGREKMLREVPSVPGPPLTLSPVTAFGTPIDADKIADTAANAPTASMSGDVTHSLHTRHSHSTPSPVRDSNLQSKLSGKPSPPYPLPTPPSLPPPSAPLSPVPPVPETSSSFPSASSGRLRSIESGGLLRPSSSRRNLQQFLYSNSSARFTTAELRCLDSLAATAGSGGIGDIGTSASLSSAFHNHVTQEFLGGSGGGTNDRRRGVFVLGVAGEGSDADVYDVDVNGNGKGDGESVVGSCCGYGKRRSDSERQTSKQTLKQSSGYCQSAATRPGAAPEDYRLREVVGGVAIGRGGGYLLMGELPRTGHLPPLTFSIFTPAVAAAAISPDPRAAAAAAAASSQSSTLVVDNDATRGTSAHNIQPNNTIIYGQ